MQGSAVGRKGCNLLLAMALMAGFAACGIPYMESRQRKVFVNVRDAVVRVGQFIKGEGSEKGLFLGSGFFVGGNCTVVTAKHLFDNAERDKIYIKYIPAGSRNRFEVLGAEIFHEDETKDLTFLRVNHCDSKDIRSLPLTKKLDDLSVLGGEMIFVGGFPRFGDKAVDYPIVRKGMIASTEFTDAQMRNPLLLLDLLGALGSSGSPVALVRTGEVVGVVRGQIKRSGYTLSDTHCPCTLEGATPVTRGDYEEAMEMLRYGTSSRRER